MQWRLETHPWCCALQALRRLQSAPELDRAGLERCVEGVRAKVAALLWHLVVVQVRWALHFDR